VAQLRVPISPAIHRGSNPFAFASAFSVASNGHNGGSYPSLAKVWTNILVVQKLAPDQRFSAGLDAPEPAPVTLDRKTSYNVGPVDTDIGPLAVGNFNATMEGFGWDRQFRGEIRNMQIFGSRASARGVLTAEEINSRVRMLSANASSSNK
jgi:hypothetical protein